MKKVLFYRRKHSSTADSAYLYRSSTLVLLYSVFFCGLLFGGAASYAQEPMDTICEDLACVYLTNSPAAAASIGAGSALLTAVAIGSFSLSPLGGLPLVSISFIKGLKYACIACTLLRRYSIRGLEYLALTVLPGAVLNICASTVLAAVGISLAEQVASMLIKGHNNGIVYKNYVPVIIKASCALILSAAADGITALLFAGLF